MHARLDARNGSPLGRRGLALKLTAPLNPFICQQGWREQSEARGRFDPDGKARCLLNETNEIPPNRPALRRGRANGRARGDSGLLQGAG